MPTTRHVLIALLAAAALIAPTAARASTTQESILEDDHVFLTGNPGPSLDQAVSLGTDTVHTLAFWNRIAPSPGSKTKPKGNLADPNSYPASSWAPYDALVRGATDRGIQVLMSPTGFTPRWAGCKKPPRRIRNCQPNPKLYQAFVTALGKRYSGSFKDASGNVLPRVKRWSIWNEPNQKGWLYPQSKAPQMYRNLVYAGLAGLKASGHGHDQILIGETSPTARGGNTDPTSFLLNVFCVDSRGHKLRGRARTRQGCSHAKRFSGVTGFAHHPYNTSAVAPALRKPKGRGDITLAVLSRLSRVLRAGAHGRLIKSGLPVYFTEYGIQTRPPNRQFGTSPANQAKYLNEADWVAYRNRSVKAVCQYELKDDPATDFFSTGLEFQNGSPKPSFAAWRLPIWVTKRGSRVSVWMWVRPAHGTPQQVQIQHNTGGGFQTVATKSTNSRGFATVTESGASGTWRIVWAGPGGGTFVSRAASAKDR